MNACTSGRTRSAIRAACALALIALFARPATAQDAATGDTSGVGMNPAASHPSGVRTDRGRPPSAGTSDPSRSAREGWDAER